jgi:hypothetical protein
MIADRPTRFWTSLELLPGLAGVTAAWQWALGDEFPSVRPLLRPRARLASTYPRTDLAFEGLPFEVVSHGPDDHVGVCQETGVTIGLKTDELVVWELDRPRWAADIARALGWEAHFEEIDGQPFTWRIGSDTTVAGHCAPVFLTIPRGGDRFQSAVQQLALEQDQPFVLAISTRACVRPHQEQLFLHRRALLLDLNGALVLREGGRLSATATGRSHVQAFRAGLAGDQRPAYALHRKGRIWLATFDGQTVPIEHSQGMTYLRWLIVHQGRRMSSAELAASVRGEAFQSGSSGELLDAAALTGYRRRMRDLEEEAAEARERSDEIAQETAQRDLEALKTEILRATGLGGRRRQASDAERLRKSVANALSRAVARIAAVHPDLARHLECFVERGHVLGYLPDREIPWVA